MTKCDFCPKSYEGKCYWNSQPFREEDCKKAIELMIKALSKLKSGFINK